MSGEHPKTPSPPKTKSGEIEAVKTFQEAISSFDDETIPKMDVEVDRMNELLKQVSSTPTSKAERKEDTPIPGPPRSPSFVDEEERDAAKESER